MIGGLDIVLRGRGADGEGAFILSRLQGVWHGLVVQEASAEKAVRPLDDSVAAMREFFVYRSRADFESWMKEGATDDNADKMIHVLLGDTSTTMVTAGPPSETSKLGWALHDAIIARRVLAGLQVPRGTPQSGSARRFRELLNDLILDLPDGERRMEDLTLCWSAMTDSERDDARSELTREAPGRSSGLELEDLDVEVGQRVGPTRRAA